MLFIPGDRGSLLTKPPSGAARRRASHGAGDESKEAAQQLRLDGTAAQLAAGAPLARRMKAKEAALEISSSMPSRWGPRSRSDDASGALGAFYAMSRIPKSDVT